MTCAVEVTRKLITPKPYKLNFLSVSSPFKTNQQNQPSCHSLEESSLRSGTASVLAGLEFISLSAHNLRKDPSQSSCSKHHSLDLLSDFQDHCIYKAGLVFIK